MGDKYEQEADQVASQVVQTINTSENVQREDKEQVQTKPLESIQRDEAPEEEDEELQMKPLSESIQRDEVPEEEDEELQMKPLSESIQRDEAPEEEDEELQMKPLSESIQRDEAPEEEDEELQMKPLSESIQRNEAPEEEDEELQMKPLSESIQRDEASEEEDEELQMKPALQRRGTVGGDASEELESSIQQAKGSGQPLDPNLQEKMGQAMGADFSSVKVHTDSQSDQLNQSIQAKAFTTGQDVFFRQGSYNPSSTDGQELIAHELTHVVQQRSADSRTTLKRKQTANNTGLPDQVKTGVENLSGIGMDDVKVHYNSSKPAQIQALAYTQGTDIYVGAGEEKHLAHEAWHVVQQKQGRVKSPLQAKGAPINSDPQLEKEADEMGDRASRSSGKQLVQEVAHQTISAKNNANMPIQRTYAALSPMAKARVDQQSEEKYASKTQEFEFKMAPKIMKDAKVNAVVDVLLARVKQIVDAWAKATGRDQAKTYEREFAWKGGDEYYGAFEMTAGNIQEVFSDKSQPMRTKLKLVYNAVRNNNLSKWLKLAAIELDRQAKKKTPRNWKIKTATQNVVNEKDDKTGKIKSFVKGGIEKEVVKTGFAKNSGLKDWMTTKQISESAQIAESEKETTGSRSKRDVFGHDRFSNVMGWKAETHKANKERQGSASRGLSLTEQRTLSVGDVPDLTKAELELLYKRKGKAKPDQKELDKFKKDPNTKIEWGQGGEFYKINLGSDSSKAASDVKARMEAGISGSTDLMLHAVQNLGLSGEDDMKGMRLALAGWMLANRDHSFYEVYKAAESYGVAFEIDKNNPGKEYESANNLSPMKPSDFADTLPENQFPSYFLSTTYKDILSGGLTEAAKDQDSFKQALRAQGLSDTLLNGLDERSTAELARLSEIVAQQTIDTDDRMAKKQQSIRRIRQHNAFIFLGNTLGGDEVEAILTVLLKKHHAYKGLTPDDNKMNVLSDVGIPGLTLSMLPPKGIDDLFKVREAIMNARFNSTTNSFVTADIRAELGRLIGVITPKQLDDIQSILWQTYHGSIFGGDKKLQADETRTLASDASTRDKALETLADANIPRAYIEGLPNDVLYDLLKLKQKVQSAAFDKTGSPTAGVTNQQEFGKLKTAFSALLKPLAQKGELILAALVKTYHTASVLDEQQGYLADFADMMKSRVDRERTGKDRKLDTNQLSNLQTPKSKEIGGKEKSILATQYWSNLNAKSRLQTNKKQLLDGHLKKLIAQNRQQACDLFLKYSKDVLKNSEEILLQQVEALKISTPEELHSYLSDVDEQYLLETLPPDIKKNIDELSGLDPKELGAIFKYTTAEYVPIVSAANSLSTKDFAEKDVADPNARKWGNEGGTGAMSTLKYTNPMMKALISGLDKMSPYNGKVYRGEDSNNKLKEKTDLERQQYAQQRFPIGKVDFRAYPLSTSTTEDAPKKAPGGDKFDIFYEISGVKTGKSIELLSNSPDEKEVLFAPGARFIVTNIAYKNGGEVWVYMTES
ncbi:DUF4157 domain-containing protein [Tumidithrix helvetica]|uniref:eCIS core domain-containing protein n=1 Tax=Tumidithrix helvetica TaxID=3457545 RepID=UPI003CC55285